MSITNKVSVSGGIGFSGLLTVVFITLKLLGVIDWAWGWVLAPLWIVAAFVVFISICLMLWAVISVLVEKRKRGRP